MDTKNDPQTKAKDIDFTIRTILMQLKGEWVDEKSKKIVFKRVGLSNNEFVPNGIIEIICSRLHYSFLREDQVYGLHDPSSEPLCEPLCVFEPYEYIRHDIIELLNRILNELRSIKFESIEALTDFLKIAKESLFKIKERSYRLEEDRH